MPETEQDKVRSQAERLEHISREIGLVLDEDKWKITLRIMAENRPLMTKPAKPENGS